MSSFARVILVLVISEIIIGLALALGGFHNPPVAALVSAINALTLSIGYQIGLKGSRGDRP